MRLRGRALSAAPLIAGFLLLPAAPAAAHPLGNFTINRYSELRVQPGGIEIDYVVDMAEIPAFGSRQEIDSDSDGAVGDREGARHRTTECRRIAVGVRLLVDRRSTKVDVGGSALSFPPGAGGLPTLRLTCRLHAAIDAPAGEHEVDYADRNFPRRIGWSEITAVADRGVLVSADVPAESLSGGLTSYPEDMLQSPLDQRRAHLRFRPGDTSAGRGPLERAAGLGALSRRADRVTQAFTSLVTGRSLTLAFVLTAFAMATLLGAVHALAPGHGKTVMAAYLVGLEGSLRQALVIGLTITATHTAGVIALGVLLSTSSAIIPERLYPWLSLASGLLLASVGAGLLVRILRHRTGVSHAHAGTLPLADRAPALAVQPGAMGLREGSLLRDAGSRDVRAGGGALLLGEAEAHRKDAHVHRHLHLSGPAGEGSAIGWRSLVALGLAGGLVPTPSALLVLLAATALGRAWLGVALVVAYGFGMAATLTGTGLLLVHVRVALDRSTKGRGAVALERVGRLLPLTTAAVVLAVGLLLAARAAAQL